MRGRAAELLRTVAPVDDVAERFAALVQERFVARPGARFVLFASGGATAAACYDRAAERAEIDWSLVDVYLGDERAVPPDHPDANQKLVREHLVEALGGVGSFTPMTVTEDLERSAAAYEEVLVGLLAGPGIDLIHLGVGPDGHTASLFPGAASLDERERLCVATDDPAGRNPHRRLSVTYPVIDAARTAVLTVSGPQKHEALQRIRAGADLPAGRVAAAEVCWLVDEAALRGDRR